MEELATVDFEVAEGMGLSRAAYDEVVAIVGRQPTADELSTLLAMWDSNGRQQSLYGWLRGQHHTVERHDYLYDGQSDEHKNVKEPRVKDCTDIALNLCATSRRTDKLSVPAGHSVLLYMVGNVSTEILDSEYARRCLHIVGEPFAKGLNADDCQYIEMILASLAGAGEVAGSTAVGWGGLFVTLAVTLAPAGFDILVPREVRLDAFLFGEEPGRYIAAVEEQNDDSFLLHMDQARLNCCFLGRTTKNRIVVDGYDFGSTSRYSVSAK
ncbi:MAG: hypothetical protein K5650_03535 [Bacteroidales bacterium]|nr:hypothetical protein [Bacteroidales bacterium]